MTALNTELFEHLVNDESFDNKRCAEYNICHMCNIPMEFDNSKIEYCCPNCGIIKSCNDTGIETFDKKDAYHCKLKILGPDAYNLQKEIYKATTTEYSEIRRKKVLERYLYLNNMADYKFTAEVLNYATDQFCKISNEKVTRRNIRNKVLAACLEDACIKYGINRKSIEISNFMRLPKSGFSEGLNIMRKLNMENKININENNNPSKAYFNRFFELLNIPENYINFAFELLDDINEKNIAFRPVVSTKCAGITYLINLMLKLNITTDEISEKCNIKKSAFISFCKIIIENKNKLDKDLFKKYDLDIDKMVIERKYRK